VWDGEAKVDGRHSSCNEGFQGRRTRCHTLLRHLDEAFGNKAGLFKTHPTARIHLQQR